LPQRRKAAATVRDAVAVSAPLPASGGLLDVFTTNGQTYVRDIQKDLVPRVIAHSGYRWHNAVARNEMLQVLRFLTISKGGVYVHWDALAARSRKSEKDLALKIAASHAHAARNHQDYVARAVCKLFQATPDDTKLCFVKEEVFGITDGGAIIGADHPVMKEMFEIPIIGALCCSLKLYGLLSSNPLSGCAGLAGNYQSKVLFEKSKSETKGETTVLQNRMHPSQQKFFDLLGTQCPQCPLPSPVFFLCIRPGMEHLPWYGGRSPQSFIRPGMEHLPWYGGRSPQS